MLRTEEIEMIIGAETIGKLRDKYLKKLAESLGLTVCPKCQNSWEHSEGSIDLNVLDAFGKPLSKYIILIKKKKYND